MRMKRYQFQDPT